jgi:hypothetical protein
MPEAMSSPPPSATAASAVASRTSANENPRRLIGRPPV